MVNACVNRHPMEMASIFGAVFHLELLRIFFF